LFHEFKEASMKAVKLLCLLSVAVFPLAPASVAPQPQSQPLMAAPVECPPVHDTNMCGRCGDGTCVKSCGETKDTCPIDCGGGVPL
jgi:hypothetical protein